MALLKGSWFSATPIIACLSIHSIRDIFFAAPGKVICFRDIASRVQFCFRPQGVLQKLDDTNKDFQIFCGQ